MNNEYKHVHAVQTQISKLYQSLKSEQAPSHVDEAILAQARLQIQQQKGKAASPKTTIDNKQSRNWRQWQWPVSVAASVLLISVIFIDQYAFFTQSQQVYPSAVAPAKEAFRKQPPVSATDKTTENAADKIQIEENKMSRSLAMDTRIELAEQESQQMEFITVKAQNGEAELHARQQANEALVSKRMASTKMAAAPVDELKQNIGAQITHLQTELNDKLTLLAKINKKQSKLFADKALAQLSETNTSLTHAEQQELELQINDLQTQLFKQMLNKLAIQTDWQVPQALVDLLTSEQQAQWAKQANKDNRETID